MEEKQPGRPLGPIAESVIDLLNQQGPLSAREIAGALSLSTVIAKHTCSRLLNRGRIRIVHKRKIDGVNKPVACYATVRQFNKSHSAQLFNFRF